ncbi:hypothetical protein [Pseudonocardia alni]|uniref:hypothetical protein n=1 Tax=Pseudonocardia alni TaxID=33907 RepID=UPI0027A389A8|nr:hypothetical protein PaSha_24275 [Pseudonocardia alni]
MTRPLRLSAVLAAGVVALAACSAPAPAPAAAGDPAGTVTVQNCGAPAQFPAPAQRLFVNDGNMISMVLALGAQDRVTAVSSMQRDADTLRRHYGAAVDGLAQAAPEYPTLETVLARDPDVMVAGWNYGYGEEKNLTPPDTRDLPAVRENRFLNLPYALWTSGPLNVDAAEQVRAALERWNLVPASGLTPESDDVPRS